MDNMDKYNFQPNFFLNDSDVVSRKDLYAIALVLLLSFLYMFFYNSSPISTLGGDQLVYNQLAVNILDGHGFSQCTTAPFLPSVTRTPAYPVFLAAIYSLCGTGNFEAVRLAQIFLILLSSLVIFSTALLATSSRYIAFISFFMFAFYGFDYYSDTGLYGYLLTESLIIFLVSSAVLLLLTVIKKKCTPHAVLLGAVMGLSMLTRPANLLFPAAAGFFLLALDHSKRMLKLVAAMLITVTLVVAPWTIRNYVQFGELIPLSVSLKGLFIYNEMASGINYTAAPRLSGAVAEVAVPPAQKEEAQQAIAALSAQFARGGGGPGIIHYDDTLNSIGMDLFKKNKIIFLQRWSYNFLSHWSIADYSAFINGEGSRFKAADYFKITFSTLLLLLITAAVLGNFRNPLFLALMLFPAYNSLIYTPLTMEYRYSMPARGLVFILIATGLYRLGRFFAFTRPGAFPADRR